MKTFSPEQETWAVKTAAKLRVAQEAGATEPAPARTDHLKRELTEALLEMPREERLDCLDALAERFPVWQNIRSGAPTREVVETVSIPQLPPEELVARLLAAAPGLDDEQRQEFARLFADVGLTTTPKPPPFELPAELRAQFLLPTGRQPEAGRALRLFAMLAEVFSTLDQAAWSAWRVLSPQSPVKRDPGPGSDFRRVAASYISGDPDVSGQQIAQLLDNTRSLIVAILGALGPAGGAFARNYLARYSPETIASVAAAEGGGGASTLR